jgi:RHS repeat-associated protein
VGSLGGASSITYQPYVVSTAADVSSAPHMAVSRAGWVVQNVMADNGIGGQTTIEHSFSGARADTGGWGFLGFTTHGIVNDATGLVTLRSFDLSPSSGAVVEFYANVGLPTKEQTFALDRPGGLTTTVSTQTDTVYVTQGNGPYMAVPQSVRHRTWDSAASATNPIEDTSTTQTFDPYGNVLTRTVTTLEGTSEATTITYNNQTAASVWLVSLPGYKTVTSTTPVGSMTRTTAYLYDGNGLLQTEIENPGPADGATYDAISGRDGVQTLYKTYGRNPNGLPTVITVSDSPTAPTQERTTTLRYDQSEGMFLVSKIDPMSLSQRMAYEPGLGVLAAATDAAGNETTYQYDTFGRIRADHPPTGGDRAVSYQNLLRLAPGDDPWGSVGVWSDGRLGHPTVLTYVDSLGRIIETRESAGRADGRAVNVDTVYDALGNAHQASRPYFKGATPVYTTTDHDVLGRVTRIAGADGSLATTSYVGNTVTMTNADGNMTAVTHDSSGRPVTSVQAKVTGPSGLQGAVTTTTMLNGPFGVLESVTDTLGNVTSFIYDSTGRLRIKNDPDSGPRALRYDVFGEKTDDIRGGSLVRVMSGGTSFYGITGGDDTQTKYDADGRVISVTAKDATQTMTWDTVYPGALSREDLTGGTTIAFTYDTFGRAQTKTWTDARGATTFGFTYDKYARPDTVTYPAISGRAPLAIRNNYFGGDSGGQLIGVADATSGTAYWTLKSTDPSEEFPVEDLANGVETTLTEDPAHPGWLNKITSQVGTTSVQALTYTREGGGRVHQRQDSIDGTTEAFGYDALERLTQWTWSGKTGSRAIGYILDDLGNLRTRSVTSGPGASRTYTFGTAGFGPHQPSSDGTTTFIYDSHGNQTTTPGRTLTFNALDLPTTVTGSSGTATLTYDGELRRATRTDSSGAVRYTYGDLFDEHTDASGDHYGMTIFGGGQAVARIETLVTNNVVQGETSDAVLRDALGSVDALVGPGAQVQTEKYDPYGSRVSPGDGEVAVSASPFDFRMGFTGHDHDDDVDLIDMIGRVYDPVQQRFLSMDPPAPDFIDGQSMNPYAYVRNNPLNATDPTGYYATMLDGFVPVTLYGGDLGLSSNANVMVAPGDPNVGYLVITIVIPYGELPGEIQGPSGQGGCAPGSSGLPAGPSTTGSGDPGEPSPPAVTSVDPAVDHDGKPVPTDYELLSTPSPYAVHRVVKSTPSVSNNPGPAPVGQAPAGPAPAGQAPAGPAPSNTAQPAPVSTPGPENPVSYGPGHATEYVNDKLIQPSMKWFYPKPSDSAGILAGKFLGLLVSPVWVVPLALTAHTLDSPWDFLPMIGISRESR